MTPQDGASELSGLVAVVTGGAAVRTAMTAEVVDAAPELGEGHVDPLAPERVVMLVQFLASPASEAVNGQQSSFIVLR